VLNLDPAKLLVIAVVAVILLGPDKLPQVARQVGAAWRSFGEFRHKMESEVRSSIPDLPSSADIARLARSPSALLNHLSNMDAEPDPGADSTSADPRRDESPVTGLPITPTDSAAPAPAPMPTPTPTPPTPAPSQADPSLN
jgi:sec-independent protein translocase protein TatB